MCKKFSEIIVFLSYNTPRMEIIWSQRGDYVFIPSIGGVVVIDILKWTQNRILNLPETLHVFFKIII